MRSVRLGRTRLSSSTVALGTWAYGGPNSARGQPVGWTGHDDRLAREALIRAHEKGIRHWDTADVYGEGQSETLIGTLWNAVPRADILLASKVGWDPGPQGYYYDPAHMRTKLEASLRYLRTEVIDLYYLHHCDFGPNDEHLDGAVETVRQFREEGKVQFLGLSDWDSARVARFLERVDPDVVQVYRSVVDDGYESSGLAGLVKQRDLGVAFFSPLRHGLLLGKYDRPTSFGAGDWRNGIPEFRDPEVLATMRRNRDALSQRFGESLQPVLHGLCGALLSDAPKGCVLLGLRNADQVDAAASVGEPVSPVDAAWVKALYRP